MSLFLSLLVEYAGLVFWWPEQEALHARTMMETELRFLSAYFTRSLVLSQPSVTVMSWGREGYQWLAENTQTVATSGTWLAVQLRVFLEATLYITVVFVVRVSVLLLSLPLFGIAAAVAMEGCVDEVTEQVFDVCHRVSGSGAFREAYELARELKPSVMYYAGVGMFPYTIYQSNLRLASFQLVGLGHGASIFCEQLGGFVMEEDFVGDSSCFS
ncbi:TPA: DUF4400 domain-containing protein [Salmonella enterica subsp. diarizonae serovar 61:r:z53]